PILRRTGIQGREVLKQRADDLRRRHAGGLKHLLEWGDGSLPLGAALSRLRELLESLLGLDMETDRLFLDGPRQPLPLGLCARSPVLRRPQRHGSKTALLVAIAARRAS